ncbi:MAG: hypothetical protein HYZ52_00330 [Candidatus Omnitrophica bacterium]|nr:hypothetical protein [Candidatus Omnitrophota bacterium]
MKRAWVKSAGVFFFVFLMGLAGVRFAFADAGSADDASDSDSKALGQFPQAEILPVSQAQAVETPAASAGPGGIDFPKVKTADDEMMAKKFS